MEANGGEPAGNGTAAAPEAGAGLALQQLGVLHDAQQQRAEVYGELQARFQRFLAGGPEADFRLAIAEATRVFQVCSDAVRAAAGRLESGASRPDLASVLRALQQEERQKLHYTLILMALRKAEALPGFSWQRPGGAAIGEASGSAGHSNAAPSHADHGEAGHSHAGGRACAHAPEPTEAEFRNAVAEATQALQAAVSAINGTLEELRYEEADLRGEAS